MDDIMESLIRRIIIPIDFSTASERAARFGCTLARNLGARVYLIHVMKPVDAGGPHLTDASGRRHVRQFVAEESMQAFADRVGSGAMTTTEIRTGAPHEVIADVVNDYAADLIVMSTHGRTGLPHLLLGSVAERVIRTAACPVLVMRDSGQIRVHRPLEAVCGAREPQIA